MSQTKSIKAAHYKGDFGYKWYKVTNHYGSAVYGYCSYKLPIDGKPGQWMTVTGRLRMCANGYHVTQFPGYWTRGIRPIRVFEVEVSKPGYKFSQKGNQNSRKSVFRHMRLLREINGTEKRRLLSRKPR